MYLPESVGWSDARKVDCSMLMKMRASHDLTVTLGAGPLEEGHARRHQRHLGLGLVEAHLLAVRFLRERQNCFTLSHWILFNSCIIILEVTEGSLLHQTLCTEVSMNVCSSAAAGSTQRLLHSGSVVRHHPALDPRHLQLVVQLLGAGPGQPERHLLLG